MKQTTSKTDTSMYSHWLLRMTRRCTYRLLTYLSAYPERTIHRLQRWRITISAPNIHLLYKPRSIEKSSYTLNDDRVSCLQRITAAETRFKTNYDSRICSIMPFKPEQFWHIYKPPSIVSNADFITKMHTQQHDRDQTRRHSQSCVCGSLLSYVENKNENYITNPYNTYSTNRTTPEKLEHTQPSTNRA